MLLLVYDKPNEIYNVKNDGINIMKTNVEKIILSEKHVEPTMKKI
jgi:hypothetical protein